MDPNQSEIKQEIAKPVEEVVTPIVLEEKKPVEKPVEKPVTVRLLEGSRWSMGEKAVQIVIKKECETTVPNRTLVLVDKELAIVVSEFDDKMKGGIGWFGYDFPYQSVKQLELPANAEVLIGTMTASDSKPTLIRPLVHGGLRKTPDDLLVKLPLGTKLQKAVNGEQVTLDKEVVISLSS